MARRWALVEFRQTAEPWARANRGLGRRFVFLGACETQAGIEAARAVKDANLGEGAQRRAGYLPRWLFSSIDSWPADGF